MRIQKCIPGFYPLEGIAYECPEPEKKVYEALREAIPKGWYAWHSMKLRTLENRFAEADYVIVDPSTGILLMEVKGGNIHKDGGCWYQNKKLLEPSPFDQAHRCRRILSTRFREKKIEYPIIGLSFCFPDTFVGDGPTQDDLRDLIIGSESLPYMAEVLPDLMKNVIKKPRQTKGGWIKELHNMWCESWVPHPQLSLRAKWDIKKRIQLSTEEFESLYRIIKNDMVLVKGGAGTGKTLLAMELAKKEAESGRRVLLLCFTDALGFELSRVFQEEPNIAAAPIGKFAVKLLRDKGHEIKESYTPEFWDPITLEAALEGMPPEEERWDTVIVDEGQDMGENDWCLIQECAEPKRRLWIFMDDTQAFLHDCILPEEIKKKSTKYLLGKPYRCPVAIQELADAYIDGEPNMKLIQPGVENKIIKIKGCEEGKIHAEVGREINNLLGEGFKGSEIAVISLRGKNLEDNIIYQEKLGGHKVALATDEKAREHIVCDTFMRFKGLERPAVIVTDMRYVEDRYATRMNIALTRASGVVRIVDSKEAIKEDQVLSQLLR